MPQGGLALGLWLATVANSGGELLFGAWIAGVGVNYVALVAYAAVLSRPDALDVELAGLALQQGAVRA